MDEWILELEHEFVILNISTIFRIHISKYFMMTHCYNDTITRCPSIIGFLNISPSRMLIQ